MIQSFGDDYGKRRANWLTAMLSFSIEAVNAIVDNMNALVDHLPKTVLNRLINKHPTQVTVGVDKVDRLEERMEALDAHLQTCIHTAHLKAASSVSNNISLNDASLGLGGLGNQHPNS